jgi:hypothetical protein
MFRWPKTDNPLEWFLEWLISGLPSLISWLVGAVANLFSWLAGTVANLFSGRATFTQWVIFSLCVAASLLLWDALTFQWLVSVSRTSLPP